MYLLISEKEITADHPRLKQPGNQRSNSRTGNLHSRHPEFTKYKSIVGSQVHEKGSHRYIQRHLHLSHTAQRDRTDQRKTQKEISNDRISEIDRSHGDDRRIRRIHPHDHGGNRQGRHCKQQCKPYGQPHHKTDRLFQRKGGFLRFALLHTPITRHQHRCPHPQPHAENMIDIDKLIGQRRCRQFLLSQRPHHDRVQHVDANRDQALERDRQRQQKHPFIEFVVGNKNSSQ